mmetsp:Transcript_13698/g.34451  ORF Transcript_13698/g.34451 Transcript_13698/m.34451 type:complete len:204 (-) Transcript_13698:11-622(-)
MSETSKSEWDFYFGRGGGSNKKRQVSKANILVHDLAFRYSYCSQTEKRLFAKNEVYDTVVKNGGTFFLVANKEIIDVTKDFDDTISRIMQSFRDINKSRRATSQTLSTNVEAKKVTNNKSMQSTSLNTKRVPSLKKSSRPKRRCIRPSVIEPPEIDCVRDTLRVIDTEKITPYTTTQLHIGELNILCDDGESRNTSINENGLC